MIPPDFQATPETSGAQRQRVCERQWSLGMRAAKQGVEKPLKHGRLRDRAITGRAGEARKS